MDFELRAPRREDAPAIAAVLNELSRALYGENDTTAAEVFDWFGAPDLDLERDGRLAVLEGRRAPPSLRGPSSPRRRSWPASARPPERSEDLLAAEDAEIGKLQESFTDMFEPERQTYDEWRYWTFTEPFDPSLWFLAEDGQELAGVCLCRPERHGDADLGWVSVLGVRRPWRRRGLGLALLHAFAELRGRGKRRVGLGVDGSSPTGAVQLYERAGMRVARRFDFYERALRST